MADLRERHTSIFCRVSHALPAITRITCGLLIALRGDQTYPKHPKRSIQTARVTVGLFSLTLVGCSSPDPCEIGGMWRRMNECVIAVPADSAGEVGVR